MQHICWVREFEADILTSVSILLRGLLIVGGVVEGLCL